MIIHDVEQGTAAWYALRLGIPTASNFDKIITPARGDLSASARKFAHYLVAEACMREPLESLDHLEWVARGKEMEPAAVVQYEFATDATTRRVGFCTSDDGRIGCSPDRLIVGGGLLEVKCPSPQIHFGYLIDGPGADYKPQVQGQLLITGAEWVDFYSFHPRCPPVTIRTYRDEAYIDKLFVSLKMFCDMKDEMLVKVRASGFFEERAAGATPVDALEEPQ